MKYTTIPAIALSTLLISCGEKQTEAAADHGHAHADGEAHDDHKEETVAEEEHDHAHDEVTLGTFTAGDMEIEAAQGHGMVEAAKEGHLVITLPYKDDGATVVRAWIGTEDRTMSAVGKGDYDAANNVYNIHAIAPTPLPADTKWWVEIDKPDGIKVVESIAPKM